MLSINSVLGYRNRQSANLNPDSNLKPKQLNFGAEVNMDDINKIAQKLGIGGVDFLSIFKKLKASHIDPLKVYEKIGTIIRQREAKILFEEFVDRFHLHAVCANGQESKKYTFFVREIGTQESEKMAYSLDNIIMRAVESISQN